MKKNQIKSAAVKTVKVSGATISLAWSCLMLYVLAGTVMHKSIKLIDEVTA